MPLKLFTSNSSASRRPPFRGGTSTKTSIPDAFELLFTAHLVDADPFGDLDGDGISNLQEVLDGTRPHRSPQRLPRRRSTSARPPSSPPPSAPLANTPLPSNTPPAYADRFHFVLESSPDLTFERHPYEGVTATHIGGGQFRPPPSP